MMNVELDRDLKVMQGHYIESGESPAEAVRLAEAEFMRKYGITLKEAESLYKYGNHKKWAKIKDKKGLLSVGVRFEQVGDDAERIIEGFLSVEVLDRQGTIIATDAILKSYDEYRRLSKMKLRVQHEPVPVGRVTMVEKRTKRMDDGKDYAGVWIQAKIDDGYEAADNTWAMIKAKALEGFSIGFDPIADTMVCETAHKCYARITALHWIETSVVDLPANPGAFIDSIRSYYRPLVKIANESREIMTDQTQGQRQEPPAAPPAEPPAEAPAEEQPLDKIMKQLDGIQAAIADLSKRVTKLEGGGEEAPPEATPPEAPPAEGASVTQGASIENTGDKNLESAHARIKELEADLAKATGNVTEPRSGATAGTPAATIEIPDDMRDMSVDDVEYLYQKQEETLRRR